VIGFVAKKCWRLIVVLVSFFCTDSKLNAKPHYLGENLLSNPPPTLAFPHPQPIPVVVGHYIDRCITHNSITVAQYH